MTQEEFNAHVEAAVAAGLALITPFNRLGYAAVIWTPEEIGDADIGMLEDIMIERGNVYLDAR